MRSLMKKFSQSAPTSCRIASGAKFNLKIGLIQNLYGIFWITIQNLYIIFWISPKKASEKNRSVNKSTSQQVNKSTRQQVNKSTSQRVNKSTSQRENETTSQQVNETTRQRVNKSTSSFRFSSIDVSTTLVGTCLRHVITNQRDGSFGLWFA